MPYVVARPKHRYEIRESRSTPRGPRSRTLATFRVLDDEVLERARERAIGDLDAELVRERARALGAPIRPRRVVDDIALDLLSQLERGPLPRRALRLVLLERLGGERALPEAPSLRQVMEGSARGDAPAELLPDSLTPMLDWLGASDDRRARALVDLLGLGDALPYRVERTPLTFPRISSG